MPLLLGIVLLAISSRAQAFRLSHCARFDQWFQQFAEELWNATHLNCSSEHERYCNLAESSVHPESIASKMLNCLLGTDWLNEATKANMASAQVLLGFLPTILTFVGCDPTETSILALRRPLLAMLVAIGSPAPAPSRSFVHEDPRKLLERREGNEKNIEYSPVQNSALITSQYVITIIAVANTVELALELGFLTVSSFAPSRWWLVILWTLLGLVVHILASVTLRVRMIVRKTGARQDAGASLQAPPQLNPRASLRDEFSFCSTHNKTELYWRKESGWLIFLSWFTSSGTAIVVIYGTVVFSSFMFIATQDATIIVLRYLVSALICRAVLTSELDGMRRASHKQERTALNDTQGPSQRPATDDLQDTISRAIPLRDLRANNVHSRQSEPRYRQTN